MAVDMFMKIGSLMGESEDEKFNKWIDVLAWSWGASQSGTMHTGGGGGGGKVNVQDFSFTKYTDIISTKLWGKCSTGDHYDKVQFRARKAGGQPFVYLEIDMDNVIITSISTGGSGGEDRTTENVTMNFKKFKIKYVLQGKDGKTPDGDDSFTFDIAKNIES